ncbi:MAG: tRNA 2-thiouridine(34) synthase MnmA [Acidobacteria bacterium]|nr:tRNA 2-thiouridine(34) synthase MnmA [Acidobacteriota bacterium]
MPETIVVAMSGGVDSSVAALLLVEAGHRVIGVTLRLYDQCGSNAKSCCALEDALAARKVASALGIEHRIVEHQEAFERLVVAPFAKAYLGGETPNPCILCNERVKFGTLWDYASGIGAAFIATGHYARLVAKGTEKLIFRGADAGKDQSYALFSLNAEQRRRTLFPVGHLMKAEVRELARRAGLPTAEKPESQDICFAGPDGYASFLEARGLKGKPGLIRHVDGRILGSHDGLHRFTTGQRRGLRIAASEPLYVVDIGADTGTLTVGPKSSTGDGICLARDWIWHLEPGEKPPEEALVQVRYHQRAAPARLHVEGASSVVIEWKGAPRTATPGQAAVAYEGDRLLGGGWIKKR